MRPKKESYAHDTDLAWFDLQNYASLRRAPLSLWATVVRDRTELARFIETGTVEAATSLFEKIKVAPLSHLGFAKLYSGVEHQANTPTVKPVTMNRLESLYDAMLRNDAGPATIVDERLRDDPESLFGSYAHLMINVHATNDQLEADFKSWLQKWRDHGFTVAGGDYENKTASWAQAAVVPSMDLELFSKLSGKRIRSDKKLSMLLPTSTPDQQESLRRRLQELRKTIFTDEMAQVLEHLASQAPLVKPD